MVFVELRSLRLSWKLKNTSANINNIKQFVQQINYFTKSRSWKDWRHNRFFFTLLFFPPGLCGYNFTDRQGNLTSPNYPSSYPNNLNCLWTITATPGDYIYLYFTYFYVQGYYSYSYYYYQHYYGQYGRYGYNSYCPYDYVEIFDLNYPSSLIKVRGCGYQSPWCVKSRSHVMHIRFVTNSIYSYTGFRAHYAVYRNPPAGGNCLPLNPYASSSRIIQATPSTHNHRYGFDFIVSAY